MARRWAWIVGMLLLAASLSAQESAYWCPAEGVSYGVSLKRAAEHIVHVDAVTHQPAKDFALPVWNALYQVRNFSANVNRVKAYEGVPEWMCDRCDTRDAQVRKLEKSLWRVESSGDHPCVTFSYDVLLNEGGPFGATVDAQFGFFNWAEVLVYRPEQRSAPVSLRLFDVPAAWRLRDGGVFGGLSGEDANAAPGRATDYDRLVDSPALLGKLAETSFEQDGATYHVAVDSPEIDMQALSYMLKRITGAGVEWMQDRPYGDYTFLYLAAHGVGSGGMEHSYSTAIDVGLDRLKQDVTSAAGVSAHEFFHLWNVKRIRPQSLEPVDYSKEQYTRALWFSEGMTSTAGDILLVRAGLMDEKHALTHLAQTIGGLEARPANRTQSAEESSLDTWFDAMPNYRRPERSISYYPKGEVLGFMLDLEMRRLTHGRRCLRDLFQYMNRRYAKQGQFFDDSEGVRLALQVLTGADFRDFFARYIAGAEALPYDDDFAYIGLKLAHQKGEQPYLAVSTSRAPGRPVTITRVDEQSAASRAGLEAGMTILEADGKPLTSELNAYLQRREGSSASIRLKVATAAGEVRELEVPVSTRKIDEYRFEELPAATAEMRARRTAFLRGEAEAEAR